MSIMFTFIPYRELGVQITMYILYENASKRLYILSEKGILKLYNGDNNRRIYLITVVLVYS